MSAGDARLGSSSSSQHHHLLPPGGSLGEPYFAAYGPDSSAPAATENATAQQGITTYLHCKVNSLGGKMVSEWESGMQYRLV